MTTSIHKTQDATSAQSDLIQFTRGGIGMGAVKVRVKITNRFDERDAKLGRRTAASVRSLELDALVDTGAVQCVMPAMIADQLGLEREYMQIAVYADGRKEEVPVTESARIEILGRPAQEEFLVLGNEVLIGQTALEKTDLFVDCKAQRLVPNPDNPDFPVIKIY